MNGGHAASVARRAVAPEPAPRSRPRPAEAVRTRERQEPRPLAAAAEQGPSTRDRLQASLGARAALSREAQRLLPGGAASAPATRAAAPRVPRQPTTRDRILNRALVGGPEVARAPGSAAVVDLAAAQSRRERGSVEEAAPDGAGRPLAPVIVLPVGPTLARPPPEEAVPETPEGAAFAETAAAGPSARGPPGAAPAAEAAAELPAGAPPEGIAAGAEVVILGAPERAGLEAAPAPPGTGMGRARRGVIRNPEDDPGFQAMTERAVQAGARAKKHQPGKEGAATAQGASEPDRQKDIASQAAHEQEESMGRAEPGAFDPEAFKTEVKKAVEGMAPPATLEEADEFKKSGKAGGAAATIHVLVSGGKDTSEQAIETATSAPPNLEGKEPKTVSKMVNDSAGAPTLGVGAAAALPGIRPAWMIDLSAGPQLIAAKLAEANVTDEQLVSANEPSFTEVLDTREEVRAHAETAPGEYRVQEDAVLARGRADAEDIAVGQLQVMHIARADTLGVVLGVKQDTKGADQQLRDDIHQSIIDIHDRTQTDVLAILATLDTTVDAMFTAGEKAARDEFERYVAEKMRAYKADRYSGGVGKLKWLKDKIWDLPSTVNAFYRDGRTNYLAAMDRLIELIAITVGVLLGLAHARILAGREEVQTFVTGLDESVQGLGAETAADLDNRFDQLASDVDAKRDELVDAVARKYVESRDALDERIEELKEANKGLVKKAIDAVVRVVETIAELTKLLLRVLLKAASAIGDIVAHPIRFLENLVGAVKGGLERFVSRIGTHLQNSLLDLLFGELGKSGITMPAQLDFAGILDLVLQVLGLTYANIRERVVERFGEPVVARMEQTVDVFKTLVKDGVAGLWTWIREKLADLEDLVVGKIKTYVIERVVGAGIGYILALLSPATAFIKACQTIYKIVIFVVEKAKQIADFVDAVLDSIGAIARGDLGGAIEKIETALAGGLTLAINFLARLANLGALSEKIRSIIGLVRKPIMRVVDGIVFGAGEIFRRTLVRVSGREQKTIEASKELTKGKAEIGSEAQPPVKPEVAPLRAPELLRVDEGIALADGPHRLQSQADPAQLVLRSGPVLISSVMDTTLRAHYQAYVQAVATYNANLAAYDDPQRALQLGGATEQAPARARLGAAAVDRAVAAIKGWVDQNGVPPTDAPGLGDVRPYAQQQSRFADIPIWRMEAEHVIPNGYFNALLEGMRLRRIEHGDEYQQMSTVMIYERAAEWKTSGAGAWEGDVTRIGRIKTWASDYFRELHSNGDGGGSSTEHLRHLMSGFETRVADAQSRTLLMINAEQHINGTHRGHAPGVLMHPFFAPKVADVKGRQLRLFVVALEDRLEESVRGGRGGF